MKKTIATIISLFTLTTIVNASPPTMGELDRCYYSDDVVSGYDRLFKGCDVESESEPDSEGITHQHANCRIIYEAKTIFNKRKIGTYSYDLQIKHGKENLKFRFVLTSSKTMTEPDNTCRFRHWNTGKYSK